MVAAAEVKERFAAVGMDVDTPRGPEAFDKLIRSDDDAVGRRCA
jgi:hypothetical protein